jgi:hypothetical protein
LYCNSSIEVGLRVIDGVFSGCLLTPVVGEEIAYIQLNSRGQKGGYAPVREEASWELAPLA